MAQQRKALKDAAKVHDGSPRRAFRTMEQLEEAKQVPRNVEKTQARLTRHEIIRDWSSSSISSSNDGSVMSDATDSEADGLVAQWLDKAQRDTKQHLVGDQEALFAEYMNEPEFFDAVIVNDDLDRAYTELKEFVMKYYWETYDDDSTQT